MRYAWRRALEALPDELDPQQAVEHQPRTGEGTQFGDVRDVPVVVVLGERGCGKSVAFEQELARLLDDTTPATLIHLGQDVYDTATAAAHLRHHLKPESDRTQHVLLDGLDEGLSDIRGLDKVLLTQLRALSPNERRRLRLRIACRTTRWPENLETGLRDLWPEPGQVAMVTLAALSPADAQYAVAQSGLDGAAFMEHVLSRGLQALAQQPATLIPLIRAQTEGRDLPTTVAEAFTQACRTLCTETWPQNFSQRQERPFVDHLLDVARWAAAALQFSRCAALADGTRHGPGELHLDTLGGDHVPGIDGTPGCGRHELLHLTESGLLTPVGQRRWVFAHRSLQEHLAAEYLATAVEPAAHGALLWAGTGQARHIMPEHQEIAARLAAVDDTLFDDLLKHDPYILLLADLQALPAEHRRRTAQAILDSAPNQEPYRIGWDQLDRLNHPGLAPQLQPFLTPHSDPDQRYLALWIAGKCQPAGLTPHLLALAEETNAPTRIRAFALNVLHEAEDPAAVARLRTLASDSKPSVAGAALEHLWPHHLSVTDYLDLLPDLDEWPWRLTLDRLGKITGQTGSLLDWSVNALKEKSPKAAIAATVLATCITQLSHTPAQPDPLLEERAGQALVALAADHELAFRTDARTAFESLSSALHGAPELRRRLASHVLQHSDPDDVLHLAHHHPDTGLFPDEDLLHWATAWPTLPQASRTAARPLLSHRPRPLDLTLRHAVDEARQTDEDLKRATAWWDGPEPKWQRRSRERQEDERRRNTFDKHALRTALQTAQSAGPDTVREAWLAVLGHLHRTTDGTRPPNQASSQPLINAVAQAPSLPEPDSDLHEELTRTALHVLAAVPVWTSRHTDPWGPNATDVPELTALGFVSFDEAHTVLGHHQAVRWAGWAVALATMTPRAQETAQHHTLLRDCAQQAGPVFDAALEPCLDVLDAHRLAEVVRTLAQLPLPTPCSIIQRWAAAPGRSAESWAAALAALAHHGHTTARALLTDAVQAGPHRDPQQQERWIRAVRVVMSFDVLPNLWPAIRRHFDEVPLLWDEVLDRTAAHLTFRHHWPDGVAALDEADLADLYRRLHTREELQRPRPEHEPGVANSITTTDRLHDLADSLLQLMADKRTQAAASQLLALADSVPHHARRLRRLALRTMRQAAERQLQPLTADQLRRLADDHRKRVISNEAHLLDVVMEALDSVQEALSAPNGLATLLWNRNASAAGSSSWWPMWEEDFSDLVTGLLKMQLEHRRVILNREVQVNRPGVGGGGRTDIHIQATTAPDDPAPVTVVIECKGCWNPTLPTALTDQLVARYLRHSRMAGVLLVGFFDCDIWDTSRRPVCSPAHSREQIEQQQHQQAAAHRLPVQAKVLDCRPPGQQT
ncbi:NACHT domain-containing protein [Streptomyces rochei]|uniref:NACHT domain-containing protein n=1 Tax=Streptomyces TaxID=1883 RepID=UPI000F7464F4|nr:HEAT repeat domain-containing protein [Streptomyces sp. WAC06273]RSS63166.1 HEAT repeat domain-containing protein [Streptomyces sp. WAC06273]